MKIQINKFKSIENLSFSIPASVSGGNGLGKSTILETISFVLTGKNTDGKEFEQVYDNKVDLHDAVADVSYFDDYGNEYQRIVKPIFQTNRAGVEEIKIKRSTECRKNGIVVNDFADEFQDFYKFGTDYFFLQKEDVQRSIFIDILKSKLPDYDVNSASLKLKELKKSQKVEVDAVEGLRDANKNTKDVPVPVIPIKLGQDNLIYRAQVSSIDPDAINKVNWRNNKAQSDYFEKKSELSQAISDAEIQIGKIKSSIDAEKELLDNAKKAVFVPKATEPTEGLEREVSELNERLAGIYFYDEIEVYAKIHFSKNPILVENAKKIKEISERVFVPGDEVTDKCPLSGASCETAKLNHESSAKLSFESVNDSEIFSLKAQNRNILEKEMSEVNRRYNSVKSDLQEAERKLNKEIEANKGIKFENESNSINFEVEKQKKIVGHNNNIESYSGGLSSISEQLTEKKIELANLIEPIPEKLPESVEISDELKSAHLEFEAINKEIIGAKAINANNAKLIESRSAEIKEKQANLLQIIEKITTLTAEISDYFSNLATVVKQEFAGDIELDVQLLEYVMSRDEYKDCFKITANGKVFPYECNGALQNNVKMQVLANLQRLKGYTGVTVMDNCEANTTQPINTCGLMAVLAFATNDNELIIK